MLDEGLGESHRTDQVDVQDAVPVRIVGLAEKRMRPSNPGVAEENVDGLVSQLAGQRVDGRQIGDVELQDSYIPLDRTRGFRGAGVETSCEDSITLGGVLASE